MNAKVIRKFDKYTLECTTSAYIELCKKFNGGLQEIANQIQKASDSKNEGMACDIIADIIVELVNGHYNKLVYESKYKKLNVDLKELKPISKEDILYNYSLVDILNASQDCIETIADSQKALIPEDIKLKPVDVELEMIEQEKKEN